MWLRFAREAGADVGEEQHELDVAAGDALLEREPAQRRDEQVGLARAGPAVEEEALRRRVAAELRGRSPRRPPWRATWLGRPGA